MEEIKEEDEQEFDSYKLFSEYCKSNRIKVNVHNAKIWDAAVKAGFMEGWKKRQELDLELVAPYTAPINDIVGGDTAAKEIYETLQEFK